MLPISQPLSNCCQAPMKAQTADEGTAWFICTACKKPCDIYSGFTDNREPVSQPKPPNSGELDNQRRELTFEQQKRIEDLAISAFIKPGSNSNKYRFELYAYIDSILQTQVERARVEGQLKLIEKIAQQVPKVAKVFSDEHAQIHYEGGYGGANLDWLVMLKEEKVQLTAELERLEK